MPKSSTTSSISESSSSSGVVVDAPFSRLTVAGHCASDPVLKVSGTGELSVSVSLQVEQAYYAAATTDPYLMNIILTKCVKKKMVLAEGKPYSRAWLNAAGYASLTNTVYINELVVDGEKYEKPSHQNLTIKYSLLRFAINNFDDNTKVKISKGATKEILMAILKQLHVQLKLDGDVGDLKWETEEVKRKIEKDTKRKIGNLSSRIAKRLQSSTSLLTVEEGEEIVKEEDEGEEEEDPITKRAKVHDDPMNM